MRVYSACLSHETNSFSPIPTERRNFEEGLLWWPRRDPPNPAAKQAFVYFLSAAAEAAGHEVWAGLHAAAEPSAPMRQAHWEALRDELLADLKSAGSVDAVLLMLHGAQMATDTPDCEGDLLSRVRQLVGPHIVIGVELDLHANLSLAMTAAADFVLPCREYPHVDFPQRAADLISVVERKAAGRINPVTAVERVPVLGLFHTTREPMRGFVDKTSRLERRPGVLAVALTHGFPWADTPFTGATVSVTTDGDPELARSMASELADEFFALREAIAAPLLSADAALDIAAAAKALPVVIAEVADNPGGGAAGDATHLIRRAHERDLEGVLAGMLWDPAAVQVATRAGKGAHLRMTLGGKASEGSGEPLELDVEVVASCPSSHQFGFGSKMPLGPTAAVRSRGLTIVLASNRTQVLSPECFLALGLDPARMRTVIVKSAQHFHAAFAPLAAQVLYADTSGTLCSDFSKLSFRRLPRPSWPLDCLAKRS